jgi:peptidoglycan-N-acetylglucosamine deacetylase
MTNICWFLKVVLLFFCPVRAPLVPGQIQELRIPPPLPPVPPRVIAHGDRKTKRIALTFDACSTGEPSQYDERVTNVLIATRTRATLFLGGVWMEGQPDHTRQLASNPLFELGNHSYLHPHMTRIGSERIRDELLHTQAVLFTLTGRQPALFRPPYGEYDSNLVNMAAECGLTTVQFDLASGDPDKNFAKETLIDWVTSSARGGSIIVMHINRRGWHTAEALPEIIARLRAHGFELVTVSELLATPLPAP